MLIKFQEKNYYKKLIIIVLPLLCNFLKDKQSKLSVSTFVKVSLLFLLLSFRFHLFLIPSPDK